MWNCCQINITGPDWWSVKIGSGNGLMPSGNKPLPEPCWLKYMSYGVTLPKLQWVDSLWPGDALWRHGTRPTLAQVMACCLTTPSHYLNQCWLIIHEVPWHSSQGIIIRRYEDTNQSINEIENCSFKMASRSPRGQWVNTHVPVYAKSIQQNKN